MCVSRSANYLQPTPSDTLEHMANAIERATNQCATMVEPEIQFFPAGISAARPLFQCQLFQPRFIWPLGTGEDAYCPSQRSAEKRDERQDEEVHTENERSPALATEG